MKKTIINKLSAAVVAVLMLVMLAAPSALAYTPSFSNLRIALYFGSTALPSANLQNVSGTGRGFEFGYFDNNRDFVSIGAWTGETAVSMLLDHNMVWHSGVGGGSGEYRDGTEGVVFVGCFHIRLDAAYDSFEAAKAVADQYQGSFVKYLSGQFYAMIGNYTTRDGANAAIASMDLTGCSVDAGTSNTVTVTRTGTSTILFEFDYGQTRRLGVMPISEGGVKSEIIFKNNRYTGGFQYARLSGDAITVVNYVEIEDYVKGILPYEMNNAWPMEALKAQACCARTYALSSLNRHADAGADLCTSEHCQVYRGRGQANDRTDRATNETAGMYITYGGQLCETYYASSNGGASENSENVWTAALPYLRGVVDPYEADVAARISGYSWTVTYTPEELTQRLQGRGYSCSTIVSMRVSRYTPTGNVLSVVLTDSGGRQITLSKRAQLTSALGVVTQRFNIGNAVQGDGNLLYAGDPPQALAAGGDMYVIDGTGSVSALPHDGLYAAAGAGDAAPVIAEGGASPDDNGLTNGVFVIKGKGRGHNVGMSQWGAYSMAEYHGKNYVEIIKFYFTGVEVG